jgi:hypothetical protein
MIQSSIATSNIDVVYGTCHLDVAAVREVDVDYGGRRGYILSKFMWRYELIYGNTNRYATCSAVADEGPPPITNRCTVIFVR